MNYVRIFPVLTETALKGPRVHQEFQMVPINANDNYVSPGKAGALKDERHQHCPNVF